MDTTDPDIQFDAQGVCNHCHDFEMRSRQEVIGGARGRAYLDGLAAKIRQAGKGKPYDCILGVSGGVDSSYCAYVAKEFELRPLAVHFDNGWNLELAVSNIETLLRRLGIELYTYVIDWDEFRDLQVAFLKASTPDSEIPNDHAIHAAMYNAARKFGVQYIISGENVPTETHVPRAWSQGHLDWKYIKSVHSLFGSRSLRTYPHISMLGYHLYQLRFKWVDILNYTDYRKDEAITTLETKLGWQYYGGKHYESIYTRFYQGYLLPKKFGYDKRRSHLSSSICSGHITRDRALEELLKEIYPCQLQEEDRAYVIKKLGITGDEFDAIMRQPPKTMWDYPCYAKFYRSRVSRFPRWVYRKLTFQHT